ncbi:TnsA endonuclease N-terminal domain-containing protein [Tenacibaculum sp. SDUM215027]|uniref:TnsA endonuclease N-terminal domain-containing protein n=1 Tax=Tenacibaculum sp. SDUM215027 TaxID=3422596 RepID=UPI003D313BA9
MNKKRVREINLKYFSLSGHITSLKNNSIVKFESSLERDYSIILEFNYKVRNYLEQPIVIEYLYKGKKRRYTPDFLVKEIDSIYAGKLIEVKYKKELEEKKETLEPKFNAAKEFCKKNNLVFEVVTENEIRTDYLENCKFLWRYRFNNDNINWVDVDYILSNVPKSKKVSVNHTLDRLTKDQNKKAELLYLIWYLVTAGLINCDLKKKINMDTKIWID